jgi:hypothetical protein
MSKFSRQVMTGQAINRAPVGGGLANIPVQTAGDRPPILRGLTRQATVTDSSEVMLAPDYDREFLFIQNNDATGNVWLAFGAPAQVGVGIYLAAGGGGMLLDNHVPTAQLNAIGSISSNANITVITG